MWWWTRRRIRTARLLNAMPRESRPVRFSSGVAPEVRLRGRVVLGVAVTSVHGQSLGGQAGLGGTCSTHPAPRPGDGGGGPRRGFCKRCSRWHARRGPVHQPPAAWAISVCTWVTLDKPSESCGAGSSSPSRPYRFVFESGGGGRGGGVQHIVDRCRKT
jgi:hypothetical protein